jgi:type I restriction enzyme R subunit
LTTEERAEVKKVAKDLLKRLKALLVINWRQKVIVRSRVRLAIEDALDSGLPRAYSPEMYKAKCSAVFEHMYEKYPELNMTLARTRDGVEASRFDLDQCPL